MYLKKNSSKKMLALMLVLALLIGGTIGGTMAWIIAESQEVENTFAVGDINIELKEHKLDKETGQWAVPYEYTKTGNTDVELLPGRSIHKDPTVTVLEGSEKCYVRVFMVIDYTDKADGHYTAEELEDGWFYFNAPKDGEPGWNPAYQWTDQTNNIVLGHVYEMRYSAVVDASAADVNLISTLDRIDIPANLSQTAFETLEDCRITFLAQAVQAAGFEDNMAGAFEKAGLPDATLDMVDGSQKTLAQIINRLETYSGVNDANNKT